MHFAWSKNDDSNTHLRGMQILRNSKAQAQHQSKQRPYLFNNQYSILMCIIHMNINIAKKM